MAKFDEYFRKLDFQPMLREKFPVHLKREQTQTSDSLVVTVKERAAKCKFPADFYEQTVRDKLTFSCKEDNYKLKLDDEGATPSLEKTVKILSLKEERKRELQESKTPEIESFTTRGNRSDLVTDQDTEQRNQRGSKRKHFGTVVTADMPLGGGTAQLRIPDVANAINWDISLSHARVYLQKQSTKFSKLKMPLAPPSWEGLPHPLVPILPWKNQLQTLELVDRSDPGWHVKLKIQDQDMLT